MKLLVTAFGPFPGMPRNPSGMLVATLARRHGKRLQRLGITLVTAELPVVYAQIAGTLDQLYCTEKPDAVLHVGVAGRRRAMSVETRAVNRLHPLRQDASRHVASSASILPGTAAILPARWPAAALQAAMRGAGARTQLSIDAGDYVCNQTLYLTLARTRLPAGFIHIPRVRGRRRFSKGSTQLPRFEDMLAALLCACLVLSVRARRQA